MNRQELSEKVEAYLRIHRDELLEDWKSLVRIPSISRCQDGKFPFGEDCARALDLALSMAAQRGCDVNNHEYWYGTALYGEARKDQGLIGIFSHLDVVEPGENWIYPPFEPTEKDGFLIGRGAGDNKSGAIIALYTMQTIKELKIPLRSNLMLYFGCNEEKGARDIERFAKEHLMPDFSLVPDLFFPVCFGEKGRLLFTIESDIELKDLIWFDAGEARNKIPERADAKIRHSDEMYDRLIRLSFAYPGIRIKSDADCISVIASGTGGHSSMPNGSINAVNVLFQFLKEGLISDEDRFVISTAAAFTNDTLGNPLGIASRDKISGNLVVSVVEGKLNNHRLRLTFDARYPISDYRERIQTALTDKLNTSEFHLINIANDEPMYLDPDSRFVKTLMHVYKEATGKSDPPYIIEGRTYARKLKNAVGYGGGNHSHADFLPKGHGAVHQPDEARNIAGVFDAIRIYVLSVVALDELIATGQHVINDEKRSYVTDPLNP